MALAACWLRIRPEILAGWDCGNGPGSWRELRAWWAVWTGAAGLDLEPGWQLDSRPGWQLSRGLGCS
ncbi:hypothetical protein TIFTF001_053228 [Ficus carica]|uniref:Uncharacterized protein n=1 Tax=Ficus carica TaxID=3494 RepID=A0AA88EH01_FICCA|nr:hypothetical protein TIFTF001_053228 [Ficus carica]